jgi:ATP-dependent DNA helicase DinG
MREREVVELLRKVTDTLPNTEERQGQNDMAMAVSNAVNTNRHLIVQAGTGTGKTLGYLVPLIASGKRIVVSTYTKALQDQLAAHDLPQLIPILERELDLTVTWSVLKGRNNYLCRQRLDEMESPKQAKLDLDDTSAAVKAEVRKLIEWADETETGDQGDLTWSPSEKAWRLVSVGSDECPGAQRCPAADRCFSEQARASATLSDVVIVNTFIYGLHIAMNGELLPEHDVVVFDEAHQLEDVISNTVSTSIGSGRINGVITALRAIIREDSLTNALQLLAHDFNACLVPYVGKRVDLPFPPAIGAALVDVRLKIDQAVQALRAIDSKDDKAKQKILRAQMLANRVIDAVDMCLTAGKSQVAFVSGTVERCSLEIAPLNVGPSMDAGVWSKRLAILASATIPLAMPSRIGLDPESVDIIDVGSPFDYENTAMLYCAKHLPEPNDPRRDDSVHDEIERLINFAGGRTLALFTTYRAMHLAADEMEKRLPFNIFRQDQLPKMALINAFSDDEQSCLFATAGFFQGVDVPGRALSLVIIDKIPFPRPDDPLLSARRDVVGKNWFNEIDIPLAATALAQASGRLIRSQNDSGVVAILDPRLATKGYGKRLGSVLPPMKRTIEIKEVQSFLQQIINAE